MFQVEKQFFYICTIQITKLISMLMLISAMINLNCSKTFLPYISYKNKHVLEGLNEIVVDEVTIKRSASVKYIGPHIVENRECTYRLPDNN